MLLTGCASAPIDPAATGEPGLVAIHGALVEAVEWARTNPDTAWTSGWTGNAVVNATDESTLGLCHEWQELVWDVAQPVAARVGWRADGIAINVGTWSEHHAVVVWDPARIGRDALLGAPADAPAYVLDPWRRGEPDVWTVAAWIDIPLMMMEPPELEDLTAEYGVAPRFGPLARP